MIGSSVVPGLPNRWVMPSSLSSARNAERPVMRFFINPPSSPAFCRGEIRHHADPSCEINGAGSWLQCRHSHLLARELERILPCSAALLLRTLPDHARISLERHQRLAGIGPFLQLLDGDVIERLAAGTACKQCARDVDHMRRGRAFVEQRRPAMGAEATR